MSQTPLQEADTVEEYSAAWGAVAWLLRQGQTWSGGERNGAFLGKGDGTFTECGGILGLDQIGDGRSVVRVDWDGDGDLDLFLRSRTEPRIMYLENRLPLRGHSVQFKLVGSDPLQTVIGARLTVRGPDKEDPVWIRTRRAGEGYLAQSSAWLHVGVGELEQVRVEVRWPGGESTDYGLVSTGSSHVLVQGETETREWVRPDPAGQGQPIMTRPEAAGGKGGGGSALEGRVVLAAPLPLPHLPVTTVSGSHAVLAGIAESLHGENRSPMVLLLWSADCAPCLKELAAWSRDRDLIANSGLSVLSLQLSSEPQPGSKSEWLDSIEWPYARGFCPESTAQIVSALTSQIMGSTRPLAVPLTLLIDHRGQLQVLYRGGVSVQQVLQDTFIFGLQGPARLRASFPFDGLYLDPYKKPDWVALARSFRGAGLGVVAKEYELALARTESIDSAESQYTMGLARLRQRNFEAALKHFDEAVKAGPGVIRYLEKLAFCQYSLGQMTQARASFDAVLVLDPRDFNTLFNLGYLLAQQGEVDAAGAVLQRLRPLDQKLAGVLRQAIDRAKQMADQQPAEKPSGATEDTTPEKDSETSNATEPADSGGTAQPDGSIPDPDKR